MSRRINAIRAARTSPRRGFELPAPAIRRAVARGKRARGLRAKLDNHYVPPEDWYEPQSERTSDFRIVEQQPGAGYVHVVTAKQVRHRLSLLPQDLVKPLEVVQFSRMTRKKQSFPCYGMQWGNTIYLYPIECGLVEHFVRPPRPAVYNEARMYGGRWIQRGDDWQLVWSPESIRDFYLNNVLIHELGHLLDQRNRSYRDRERYAEWFAIEYGYKPSRRKGI